MITFLKGLFAPPGLADAERLRIENQAILRYERERQARERLGATIANAPIKVASIATPVADATVTKDTPVFSPVKGDETIVVTQVLGHGARKGAMGFELLGKGWAGRNNKDSSPFCYFPVKYRDGANVDSSEALIWVKLYDEQSAMLLLALENQALPVQAWFKGELDELPEPDVHYGEDGTRHINWRLDVAECALIPGNDPRYVRIARGRKVSRAKLEAYMPHVKPREITDFESLEELDARMRAKQNGPVRKEEAEVPVNPQVGLDAAESHTKRPRFGVSPDMD